MLNFGASGSLQVSPPLHPPPPSSPLPPPPHSLHQAHTRGGGSDGSGGLSDHREDKKRERESEG